MNYEHRFLVITGPPDAPTDERWAEFEDRCTEALLDVPRVDDGGFDIDDWNSDGIEVAVGFDGVDDDGADDAVTRFAYHIGGQAVYRLTDDGRRSTRVFDHRRREHRS